MNFGLRNKPLGFQEEFYDQFPSKKLRIRQVHLNQQIVELFDDKPPVDLQDQSLYSYLQYVCLFIILSTLNMNILKSLLI